MFSLYFCKITFARHVCWFCLWVARQMLCSPKMWPSDSRALRQARPSWEQHHDWTRGAYARVATRRNWSRTRAYQPKFTHGCGALPKKKELTRSTTQSARERTQESAFRVGERIKIANISDLSHFEEIFLERKVFLARNVPKWPYFSNVDSR